MFTVSSIRYATSPLLHCVELMCECHNKLEVDVDNFQEITSKYVVFKNNAKITCPKCGKSQPKKERMIYIGQSLHTPRPANKSMFTVHSLRYAKSPLLHCIELMCKDCPGSFEVDVDNFKEINPKYVILKRNAKITCPKCDKSQPQRERIIYIPQVVHTPQPQPSEKDKWEKWLEFMATLEWE